MEDSKKTRIIQEYVPGKQVTLCHLISKPDKNLYDKLGLMDISGSIGILTITPGEGAIVGGDIALKTANVHIGYLDRFNGSLVIYGDVSAVESSLKSVVATLNDKLGFHPCAFTKS